MNLTKILSMAILILAVGVFANAQEPPQAILVDEYSYQPSCDDFIGRLDGFLSELRLHANWTAVIVLRDTPARRVQSATLQSMIEAWFDYREFDRGRIEIIRADADKPSRQFWRKLPQMPKPAVERIVSGFQMSEAISEPFILAEVSFTHICPEIDELKIFANFLRDNPYARGNIVVRDRSAAVGRKTIARILKILESTYRISRRRLRVFVAKPQKPSNHGEAIVEYWYLP